MAHRPGLISKATSAIALLIGASDVIFRFQENPQNPAAALENLAVDYSAGLTKGNFDYNAAIRAYGPLVGAYGFKKAMSFLTKRFRM